MQAEQLRARLTELAESEEVARVAVARDSARAEQRASELEKLRTTIVDCSEEKEQLTEERRHLLEQIQDLSATEREINRERELAQVCRSLSHAISGVRGRVVDMCRPSQKRLHVAVNVALGKFLDAVVVDTSETARACVRYLKEHTHSPLTFLPISDLKVPESDPRLQELVLAQRGMRLALHCVSFDEQYARAFEFLLGDVVIADTMADGRRFAYGDVRAHGIKCRVVTLAGEAIAKNGNLSVNSDATQEGSTRFDLTEVDVAKGRLEVIDRRLYEIHSLESTGGVDMVSFRDDVKRAEAKASEASLRLKWCKEQLQGKEEELKASEEVVKTLDPEEARLTKEEAALREEQRHHEEYVGKAVFGHFRSLSVAMGVDDIRKKEREWCIEREGAQLRAEELTRRMSNVKAELDMLQQTLNESTLSIGEETVPKLMAEVEDLTKKEMELAQTAEALSVEEKGHESHANSCASKERDMDKLLGRLRNDSKEKRQNLLTLEKQITDLGSELRSVKDLRSDLLKQSVLEDIAVPLLEGGPASLQDLTEAPSQAVTAPTQRPRYNYGYLHIARQTGVSGGQDWTGFVGEIRKDVVEQKGQIVAMARDVDARMKNVEGCLRAAAMSFPSLSAPTVPSWRAAPPLPTADSAGEHF